VSLTSAPLGGKLYWTAAFADGSSRRFDASGLAAPVSERDFAEAARRIAGTAAIAEQGLVNEADAYYYALQRRRFEEIALPYYRIILKDDEQTRFYLDASTGALVHGVDSAGRWRRWLFSGLHRLDFAEWMRERPFRDVLMWLTLLGGLALSVTGVWLAIRRVRSDVIMLWQSVRRLAAARRAPETPLSS
jgi:hypothetical protein